MKIRTDFVTNSSSSSYVIIGNYATSDQLSEFLKKGKRILASISDPYEGGRMVFNWDKDFNDRYNEWKKEDKLITDDIDFYRADFVAFDGGDGIELPAIKKGSKIFFGETSINGPSDIEGLEHLLKKE